MADLLLDEQSVPATPAAGKGIIFVDSIASIHASKDDSGRVNASSSNSALANIAAAAADTYLTNSDLLIPSWGLQARSQFRWVISASKTGAGAAAPAYNIRIGGLRTVVDVARLTLNGPLQTAVADIGVLEILATVRNIGAASVIQASAAWRHNAAAAGFANNDAGAVEGASAGFDSSGLAGQYIGLSINPGAAAAWTITQVQARADW